MKTHKSTWKKRESAAAGLFGAKRQPLSGSSGRDDRTRSDSTHPGLFIETKLRQRHAVRALFVKTKLLAHLEHKVPVLALATKGMPGFLLVVDSEDLPKLVLEFLKAHSTEIAIEND